MRPHQARFITACQQLLALGVVLAVLTPAAAVVSLDVIGLPGSPSAAPSTGSRGQVLDQPADHGRTAAPARHEQGTAPSPEPAPAQPAPAEPAPATVPTEAVEPTVTEVALTPEEGEQPAPEQESRREAAPEPEAEAETDTDTETATEPESESETATEELTTTTVVSEPQAVEGYGAIGITWSHAEQVDDHDIAFEVRTKQDGAWTDWSDVEYHDEHGPDPASPEGRDARPGTDPVLVGEVDEVQVRAVAADALPADMSLAVIEPGEADEVTSEEPELTAGVPATDGTEEGTEADGAIELQAASTAPRPTIFSRAQWGADESMRDRSSLRYGTISAGFVHHTVNANDYTRAEVPGIIRGIYAYHVRSRGWSDVGYNFLVDKFGRIWEGRAGGVDRPVVGAHTLGYNEYSFAMSAIGNFDTVRPPDVMLRAYGDLFAWKLGLHGVDPADTSQRVGSGTFKAINGHRDAGSTACPGRYLYEKLGTIRTYASQAAAPLEPERLVSNLAGSAHPDLVVRRASDARGFVLPTGGLTSFARPSVLASSGWDSRPVVASPDLTGDGRVDLVTLDATGALEVRPGTSSGGFAAPSRIVRSFRGHHLSAAVGDVDGDGLNDLAARRAGDLVVFRGTPTGGFRKLEPGTNLRGYVQLLGAGDVTGDGRADLWARGRSGQLFLHRGRGDGTFTARTTVAGTWTGYDWFSGGVDYNLDGVPDLIGRRTDGRLMVLPARGDGTLAPAFGPVLRDFDLGVISGAGQVVGDSAPDLVAVRDGALVAVRNRGRFDLGRPIDTGQSFGGGNLLLNAGDFDGSGEGDVIMRRRRGAIVLYRGNGTGRLKEPVRIGGRQFGKVTGLRTVADVTGDGKPDLMGVKDATTTVWPGNGADPVGDGQATEVKDDTRTPANRSAYDWVIEVGDLQLKGQGDLVVRDRDTGGLYRVNGLRDGLTAPRYLGEGGSWNLGG
jgi:hypothetical protein